MSLALSVLAWLALGLIVTVWLRLAWLSLALRSERVQRLERPDLEGAPEVTALIPTYNEARDIEDCVRALLAVDYPALRILVSDDGSQDDTVAKVEALAAQAPAGKLRVISTPRDDPRREGWRLGKSFALWVATRELESEWLWFIDADVRVDPDALWRSLETCRLDGSEGFTCGGRYPNPSPWAEALEVWLYTVLFNYLPLRRIRDPEDREASWLTGQYYLIRRATYEALGGHESVKPCAMDDLPFGRVAKRAGHPFTYYPAAKVFTCRNYVSFGETWRNWIRMCVLGSVWIDMHRPQFVTSVLSLLVLGLLAPLALAWAWYSAAPPLTLWPLVAANGLTVLLAFTLPASMGRRVWTAPLYPLWTLASAVLLSEACLRLQGEVTFHGQAVTQDRVRP